MNADEARKVAREIATRWFYDDLMTAAVTDTGSSMLIERVTAALLAAAAQQRKADARVASQFSMKPDASLTEVPVGQMNENARHIMHATAQEIAAAIREQKP